MVYHVDDVYNIIKEYKDDDEEQVIYCIYAEQDLSDIIYQLYKTYIPDIEFETGRVSKVIYKSKNVKVIVKCQDIITSSIERTIGIIDDIDVYNRMNIQMTKFNKALFKMQYKSYYTDQDIDILNEYRTVPNIGFFQQRPIKVKLCEIDVSKAYTSALTLITKVPIFNEFDSFQPYDMHGIKDMHLYII